MAGGRSRGGGAGGVESALEDPWRETANFPVAGLPARAVVSLRLLERISQWMSGLGWGCAADAASTLAGGRKGKGRESALSFTSMTSDSRRGTFGVPCEIEQDAVPLQTLAEAFLRDARTTTPRDSGEGLGTRP